VFYPHTLKYEINVRTDIHIFVHVLNQDFDINTTHNIKKVWRYQRGNQKWPIKSHQSKDRQYNGEKVNDKQWSTTHYTEN
jgi:hypothetical protein